MDQDSVTMQRAAVDDAALLTDTCKRAYDSDSKVGAPGPGGPPGYDSLEWNVDKIKNQYLQYYKILNGKDIVGGFIIGDRGPGYQVCERIWIDPDYMRRGIGTKAFELIWEMYPAADLWALGTPEWNQRTNPFYQRIGFVQIGTTHEYTWNGIYYQKRMADGFPKAMSKIGDIHNGQQRIIVEAHVDHIASTRTVTSRKTGEELRVADATITDDTGSITLVLWEDQIRQVKADSRIRTEEGHAKAYRDNLQLTIGKWGMIITLSE
ncbi:MAG: GNAT family N-acetyltransferase [Candidatus Thorarchaeota archaeon]